MRVHFIGIGGTAMATLAALLRHKGMDVRGSDEHVYPPMSDLLAAEGIRVLPGYRAEHITEDIDLVVVGNAVSRGNPEVEEVLDRKVRYCSLPEALRNQFLWGARSIVVTGTHGKTTTTALTGWLLTHAGSDPTVFIGGMAANFGASYRIGHGRDFVIEGDEYDSAFFDKTAKFLKYLPDVAIVGNVEFDHADIYADLAEIRLAFQRFVNQIPRHGLLLVGHDDPEARALRDRAPCRAATFGLSEDADWQAYEIGVGPNGTRFRVRHGSDRLGEFGMPLLGDHNVLNALAAIAVGHEVGVDAPTLAAGLGRFKGIRRRLERRGVAAGVTVYDDFAHHPTAIARTLAAVRQAHPAHRIWAVFEPRSATACRAVFQEAFARAFVDADEAIIAPVYRSNLPASDRLSADRLVSDMRLQGTHARAIATTSEIVETIRREHRPDDLVVVMSNGAFDGIHAKLLTALGGAERAQGE